MSEINIANDIIAQIERDKILLEEFRKIDRSSLIAQVSTYWTHASHVSARYENITSSSVQPSSGAD